ncbi:MAG: dTMP kinase [Candidatus Aenigmatarchaeota archaeon]
MQGKFLVVEGPDFSGKTTQVQRIANYLLSKGHHLLITHEPTKISPFSSKIREILEKSKDVYQNKEKLTELFVKDRFYHIKKIIKPVLKKGINVISDRYDLSTLAYQHTQGMPLDSLLKLHKGIIQPDLTIVIDVKPENLEKRRRKAKRKFRAVFEKPEMKEFRKKLVVNYKKISRKLKEKGRKIEIVDGNRSEDEIFKRIKKLIDKIFNF